MAFVVGAVVSLICRTVNVAVLAAATLSFLSVARYSTLYVPAVLNVSSFVYACQSVSPLTRYSMFLTPAQPESVAASRRRAVLT